MTAEHTATRPPRYEPTQEVRFAVVMYGGVSLAIYINGVVQELLQLVRATAPAEAATSKTFPDALLLPELDGTAVVYRKLGQLLEARDRAPEHPRSDEPAPEDPVLSRFVVDILSGSSAGGINGIFLAKALANDLPLDVLKRLWVTEGDLVKLLHDSHSYADLPSSVEREEPPASLLNTRRMYYAIFQALQDMAASRSPDGGDSPLVDELDLWITATDVHGLVLPIDLYDNVVFEPRYRNTFRFSYMSEYASGGATRNGLAAVVDPVLAFAARATSSFPFAFEPMTLDDVTFALGQRVSRRTWEPIFRDYLEAGEHEDPIRQRPFVDGGYLDNKPFTWSTNALQRRQADLPVDRKLIYVEPDPGALHALRREEGDPLPRVDRSKPLAKPDAIGSSFLAFTLPRKETIREDLERLLDRNRVIARVQRLSEQLEQSAEGEAWSSLDLENWLASTPEQLASAVGAADSAQEQPPRGIQYLSYYRLKLATVLDDLAEVAAIQFGFDPNSDECSAIRCFLQAWFDSTYAPGEAQNRFLLDFDLGFRIRRTVYVQHRIDALVRSPEVIRGTALFADLLSLRRRLNWVLVRLRRAGRELRHRDDASGEQMKQLLTRHELLSVLAQARNEQESVASAERILEQRPKLAAYITSAANAISSALRPTLEAVDPRSEIAQVAARHAAASPLLEAYDRFELIDSVTLPVSFAETGEANRVEVIRISPEDATAIRDEIATGIRKLGGIEVGHFGGFLHEGWRKNDLLWGRLDAAERIITTLLRLDEVTEELRNSLVREAHLAIIRDEYGLSSEDEAVAALERLRTIDVDRDLPPREVVPLVRRAVAVTGSVLGGIAHRGDVSGLSRMLAGVLGPAAALVELAGRAAYWAPLPPLAAIGLLIGLGSEFDCAPAARTGWSLLPYVVLGSLFLIALKRRIEGLKLTGRRAVSGNRAKRLLRSRWVVIPSLLLALFLLVIFPLALLNDDISTVVSWLPGWSE